MKYIKTIIVEDTINSAELLKSFIDRYCPKVIVEGTAHTLNEAKKLINEVQPSLLFLDIQIGNQTIFDLFDKEALPKYQIIFTTAYDKYALDAFKLNTIDYLLKPINISELKEAVNRALEKSVIDCRNFTKNIITISSQKETILLREEEIVSCSANGKYTIFSFISGNELVSSKNIGEYEKLLTSPSFFRIHKSHIINLNYLLKINKVSGDFCLLKNGKSFPLAKRRKDELKKLLRL